MKVIDWLLNKLVERVLYYSTLTCFFFGQKALLALPPFCLPLKRTTANLATPLLSPPVSLFCLYMPFHLSAAAVAKLNHLTQPATFDNGVTWHLDLWPTPLSMQCSYHAGQWLSCPLFLFSCVYRPRLLPHLPPHCHHLSPVLLQTASPRHLHCFLRRILCYICICSRWVFSQREAKFDLWPTTFIST